MFTPIVKLNYPQLVPEIVKVTYSDPLTGSSPDIELNVIDKGKLPVKAKDTLQLELGRANSPYRLRAGLFEIDRIGMQDPITRVRTIAATGLPLSDPELKVKRDADYSQYRLGDILTEFAARYGLSVFTRDLPLIEFSQLAQTNQSDLDFLNSLGNRLGALFKIENKQLIFSLLIELEKRAPIFSISNKDFFSYSETVLNEEVYQYIDYEIVLFGDRQMVRVEDDRIKNGLVKFYRGAAISADDPDLVVIAAREQLRQINGANYLFNIEILGRYEIIAGSTFLVDGRLAFVDRAVHTIDIEGKKDWIVALNCRYLP
jgi:hypothetical protein